jgi:glycosyltransferase involved in cell wall biosynthesis
VSCSLPLTSTLAPESALPPAAAPARPLSVLHVVNGEYYAGAERVQDLLALGLPQFGCRPGFVCVKPGRFAKDRRSAETPLVSIPLRHPWDRRAVRAIAELVQSAGYDLLHAHTPRSAWAALSAGRITGRPVVYTIHDLFLGQVETLAQRLANHYTIRRLRQAAMVIAVSPEGYRLAERLRLGKSRGLVLNGVPAAGRLAERGTPDEWTLGTVALIRPSKGIEILIRATARLRDRGRKVKTVVVGPFHTPQYEREIRQLVHSLGAAGVVELAGFSGDVPAHLRTFDLFVLPSVGPEGLPMVMLEAMAHGVPVIGSDVPGIGDVLRDGIDGRVVRAGSTRALADGIDDFLLGRCDWQAARRAVFRRHRDEFSDQRMARETAGIYRMVAGAM